ncbi:MAG: hypothetical protein PHO33_01230 [Clostridia bacterium]|jgi:hypothetical protein|nr:hypothetical protein [Clostridia bacterium]MDD4275588.1 hypothetical protein [Clostridia bacterium]
MKEYYDNDIDQAYSQVKTATSISQLTDIRANAVKKYNKVIEKLKKLQFGLYAVGILILAGISFLFSPILTLGIALTSAGVVGATILGIISKKLERKTFAYEVLDDNISQKKSEIKLQVEILKSKETEQTKESIVETEQSTVKIKPENSMEQD